MRRRMLLAIASLSACLVAPDLVQAQQAQQDEGAAFVVTFIEVGASETAAAAKLLKDVADASRKEQGNVRYEVLQRDDWQSHFAILEVWRDAKAFNIHAGGPAMTQLRAQLKPIETGHYDQRPGLNVGGGPEKPDVTPGATYVITHVDVTGNTKDQAIVMLNKLAEESRKEPGAERFEVWEQANRLNHFNLDEVWANREAYEAHIQHAGTKEFREKIGPNSGRAL